LTAGQVSELSKGDEFRRATLRLREISALLNAAQQPSPLLAIGEVNLLIERLNSATMPT
jgi:hypothetical protein